MTKMSVRKLLQRHLRMNLVLKRSWEKKFVEIFGYFDARKSDYSMKKVNFPKNTLIYINQSSLTVKKNKKILYCEFFIIGQTVETTNTPQDIFSYNWNENEVKMVRQPYDAKTGEFKGLYETVGFLVARDSPEEVFLNHGFDKEK